MKKLSILLLLVFIVRTAVYAQTINIKGIKDSLNEQEIKKFKENSTLIIEGKFINGRRCFVKTSSAEGDEDYLVLIKPTAVLSGNCDSSKTYKFLIVMGNYSGSDDFIAYGGGSHEGGIILPHYGIFFLNDTMKFSKPILPIMMNGISITDVNKLYPDAIYVGYIGGIDYATYKKEKTLQFLNDRFNLKATLLK